MHFTIYNVILYIGVIAEYTIRVNKVLCEIFVFSNKEANITLIIGAISFYIFKNKIRHSWFLCRFH